MGVEDSPILLVSHAPALVAQCRGVARLAPNRDDLSHGAVSRDVWSRHGSSKGPLAAVDLRPRATAAR